MYKLIVFDGDGTLLNSEMRICGENKKAIKYAQEKGVRLVLCSGRSFASLKVFGNEIGLGENDYIIGFNGGTIYKALGNEPFYEVLISEAKAKLLISEILKVKKTDPFIDKEAEIVVYDSVYSILAQEFCPHGEAYAEMAMIGLEKSADLVNSIKGNIYKILVAGDGRALKEVEKHLISLNIPGIDVMYSWHSLMEIIHSDAQKGAGLAHLAGLLGIPMSEVVAIGDQSNDLSMIAAAGMGVAMLNGIDEAKEIADWVTERDNNDCGVAEVVYRFIK
jgi:hypothetical protein